MEAFVDGGGNRKGNCYYGIAFYRDDKIVWKIGHSLPDCETNNEAEYDALYTALLALRLVEDLMDAEDVTIYMDSELVVKQVLGEYDVKADNLAWRATLVRKHLEKLREQIRPWRVILKHIPREENEEADKVGREALRITTND